MGKRQNSSKRQKKENLRRKQIESQIANLEAQMKLSKAEERYEQEVINRKRRTFTKKCMALLQNIGFVACVTILVAAIVFLAILIYMYFQSDTGSCPFVEKYEELKYCPILNSRTAITKVFNIVQLLAGIISVVVGIWALVLTYKSRRKPHEHELHISKVIVDTDSLDGYKENDLNPKSLG